MNITRDLIARIEEYRASNKNPCKNYGTEDAADKAGAEMAMSVAHHFAKDQTNVRSARYVVLFVPAWGRWVACIDMSELINRSTSTGGYLGYCKGFYTF